MKRKFLIGQLLVNLSTKSSQCQRNNNGECFRRNCCESCVCGKMADGKEVIKRVWEEKLGGIILKSQQEAMLLPLNGKDVFALLPTGFGKSLTYQSFVFVREILYGHAPTIILVIPLRSIVQGQLASNKFNIKAVELTLQEDVLKKSQRRRCGGGLQVSKECPER